LRILIPDEGLPKAILRDQGLAGKPARDDGGPLHEAALLVQPLAVPVRMGSVDPQPQYLAADEGYGVLGRREEHTASGPPPLLDPYASAALGQPEVRLGVTLKTIRTTQ
jgi:hypothetical protein